MSNPGVLSDSDIEHIVNSYNSGVSIHKLSKELGVSYATIQCLVSKFCTKAKEVSGEEVVETRDSKGTARKPRGRKKSVGKTEGDCTTVMTASTVVTGEGTPRKPRGRKKSVSKTEGSHNVVEVAHVTLAEKVAYCDSMYGAGNWQFMSREEFVSRMMLDRC